MKKILISLFIGLALTNSLWCMEPGEQLPFGDEVVKITTNDEQEIVIPRDAARFSQTLNNLIEDLGMQASIPLPQVSSSQWKVLYEVFVDSDSNVLRNSDEVGATLETLDTPTLLSLFDPLDYLEPLVKDREGKLVDSGALVDYIIKMRMMKEPQEVIKALRAKEYKFPGRFEPSLADALLRATNIISELEAFRVDGLGVVKSLAWSGDGRLALLGDVLLIRERDGKLTPIDAPQLGEINAVAWAQDGRLAIGGKFGAVILELNGKLTGIKVSKLGEIYAVAWSADGRLAIGGRGGAVIREKKRKIVPIKKIEYLGPIYSLAWSSGGRLALGGDTSYDGVAIKEVDGSLMRVNTKELVGHFNSVAWSPDGRLAISGKGGVAVRDARGGIDNYLSGHDLANSTSVAWSLDGQLAMRGIRGTSNVHIRKDGAVVDNVRSEALSPLYSIAWEPNERLALGGKDRFGFYAETPEEYKNLTMAKALLIIRLAGT